MILFVVSFTAVLDIYWAVYGEIYQVQEVLLFSNSTNTSPNTKLLHLSVFFSGV